MAEVDKRLIPEGMSMERYRELIKRMNDPASIGDKEIDSIKNHWKNYTSKKSWGTTEKLDDVIPPKTTKPTSTQAVSNQAVKNSQQNVVKKTGKTVIKNVNVPKSSTIAANSGAATPFQAKVIKNAPKIMKGAALFIGTTSILSKALDMSEKAEQKAQTRQMEKKAEEKVKQEKQKREDYKVQNAFGRIDTSGIVMEMFDQRIGHHKMGNSRF